MLPHVKSLSTYKPHLRVDSLFVAERDTLITVCFRTAKAWGISDICVNLRANSMIAPERHVRSLIGMAKCLTPCTRFDFQASENRRPKSQQNRRFDEVQKTRPQKPPNRRKSSKNHKMVFDTMSKCNQRKKTVAENPAESTLGRKSSNFSCWKSKCV